MQHHSLALLTLTTFACSVPPTSHGPLTVSASALEWVAVAGGERQVQSLEVGNAGDGDLVVTPLLSPGDARFSLVSSAAPVHLTARSSTAIEVAFDPDQATPALAWLQLAASDGTSLAIRLRAEVEPRADCTLWALLTSEYGQRLSPVPLEVHAGNSGGLLDGPWRWSLAEMPDLKGPRLFADDQPYGLTVGLGASPSDDEMVGGGVGHLNVVTHSAPHTVRVRDDAGRGCEATFFADVRIPGEYPAVSVQLTWLSDADLDLHVARTTDGEACFASPNAPPHRRCDEALAELDCSSRRCDADDWNGELYSGLDDVFYQPHRHPTGQGAELIYLPGTGSRGTAAIAVEAIDAAGPVTFRVRVFHGRLGVFERTGIVLPGELHEVTTTTY